MKQRLRGVCDIMVSRSNSKEITLYGRGLVEGEGEAIVIRSPFSFAHGIDPKTEWQ